MILAVLFMIFYPLMNERPDKDKEAKATAAAMEFLQLVDSGEYAESWDRAATLMEEKVTRDEWVEKLTGARARSGALVERKEKSASYSTTAQDSPDGEYILLIYESRFQKTESIEEYVTVMLEDGRWKVAGYFLQ
jgi:hypothetical protein